MEPKDRHKTIRCEICNKNMRSDNLKMHLKSKKCILTNLNKIYEKESTNSIHLQSKEIHLELEKISQTSSSAVKDFKSIEHFTSFTKDNDLKNTIIKNNHKYIEAIELGKQIADIFDEVDIHEDSLSKKHEKALNL